mgnify:CR=1 FL=1
MKTRIGYIWEQLRSTYWFVPLVIFIASVALATGSILLDRALEEQVQLPTWLYPAGADEARALLSTIAGSMIGLAGVTFSITMVTLSLASSQFGSRLLRTFMRDIGNQVVLGTFIGTFVYAILVLQTITGVEERVFVPKVSLTIAMLLAVLSLAVLIYFIHHVSASIQAENVIAGVGRDLDSAVDRLFPEQGDGASSPPISGRRRPVAGQLAEPGEPIPATQSGYLQAIDQDRLMRVATENDLVFRLLYRPGDFIIEGSELVLVWPAERAEEGLVKPVNDAFIVGARRLQLQDVEFAINQLVEIAVRALSPGINDPFTAIACIDRLGASLARLAERGIPPRYHFDEEDRLRLITDVVTFSGIVDAAFNQIRQNGRSNVAVTIRLLERIAIIAAYAQTEGQRAALRRQTEMIWRSSTDALPEALDRADVQKRYRLVLRTLQSGSAPAED